MTTEDALLAAVLAAPDDDLPRLVLADHYEGELGQPERAGYIRDEVNHAKLDRELLCHQPDAQMGDWCNDSLCPKCGQQVQPAYLPHSPEDLFVSDAERAILDRAESVVWHRGFISEIRCTLAEWCGGRNRTCTRCNYVAEHPWEDRCPSCNSHRLLQYPQGIGPQIVRRHPVTRVVLTDREPLEGVSKFLMWSQGISERPHAIPLPVWSLLTDYAVGSSTITRFYPTREAAISALSAALVAWAKSQPHRARIHTSPVSVDVTA